MSKITLCSSFKDEELNVESVYDCVKDVVDDWVVLDSNSTDRTVEICKDLGARVYPITHPLAIGGYGGMRTLLAHLAKTEWLLILDGDERILPEDVAKFPTLAETSHDFIFLPRQHYRNFDMSIVETRDGILENPTPEQQVANIKQHPDWQPRFFRSLPHIKFERMVHERAIGMQNPLMEISNPVIRHFGYLKTDARLQAVAEMCDVLWKSDKEHSDSYKDENEYGHAMMSPKWIEFWERCDLTKTKDKEWMKEYRRYWK